jgi:hypothetical protein
VPGTAVLRSFVAARVAENGMRATARDVGVQPFGLKYFVDGGKPHASTVRKLEDWYLRMTDPLTSTAETEDAALVALGVLVRNLPVHRQDEAIRQSIAFYRELYQALDTDPPAWLRRLLSSE